MIYKLINELSLQSGKTNLTFRGHQKTTVLKSKEVERRIFVVGSVLHNYISIDLADSMKERTKKHKNLLLDPLPL